MDAAIKLDGVTKRYGAFTAVRDLSFTVKPGTILGFLGLLVVLMRRGQARQAARAKNPAPRSDPEPLPEPARTSQQASRT